MPNFSPVLHVILLNTLLLSHLWFDVFSPWILICRELPLFKDLRGKGGRSTCLTLGPDCSWNSILLCLGVCQKLGKINSIWLCAIKQALLITGNLVLELHSATPTLFSFLSYQVHFTLFCLWPFYLTSFYGFLLSFLTLSSNLSAFHHLHLLFQKKKKKESSSESGRKACPALSAKLQLGG